MSAALVPVLVLVLILAIDLWVFTDAKRCADAGLPVTFRLGALVVDTPAAWFVACLVLWPICFPLYVRSRAG